MGGQYLMAKMFLWVIVVCMYIGMYNNYNHHVENSRWGFGTMIGIICFIAIIEVVEKVKRA